MIRKTDTVLKMTPIMRSADAYTFSNTSNPNRADSGSV